MSRPTVLIATPLQAFELEPFQEEFDIIHAPSGATFHAALAERGPDIRAIVARNLFPIGAAELRSLPALELVVALGSGSDAIDGAALAGKGVLLATGHGVNAAAVADHAMALLLALVRNVVLLDRATRERGWGWTCEPPSSVSHLRLGIVGLGAIGCEVARRADAFGMAVAYHGRAPHPDAPYAFHADLPKLAAWSDALVLSCPGSAETRHLVNRGVLEALGGRGYLVNVSRGSVVDTAALTDALETRRIAAAGLDVLTATAQQFERLTRLPNLLMTPHTAGRSPESLAAALDRGLAHLRRHFFRRAERP